VTIVVNTFEDVSRPPPGTISLRSAIVMANRSGQPDTIVLPAGVYTVTSSLGIFPKGRVTIESEAGGATIKEVRNSQFPDLNGPVILTPSSGPALAAARGSPSARAPG
jgi:hypothetical protein